VRDGDGPGDRGVCALGTAGPRPCQCRRDCGDSLAVAGARAQAARLPRRRVVIRRAHLRTGNMRNSRALPVGPASAGGRGSGLVLSRRGRGTRAHSDGHRDSCQLGRAVLPLAALGMPI
jgi:hypothetical protein